MKQKHMNKLRALRDMRERLSLARVAASRHQIKESEDRALDAQKDVLRVEAQAEAEFAAEITKPLKKADPNAQYLGILLRRRSGQDNVSRHRQIAADRQVDVSMAQRVLQDAQYEFQNRHMQMQRFNTLRKKQVKALKQRSELLEEDRVHDLISAQKSGGTTC